MYPSSIRNLIECLKNLPGIGEKSAERLAYAIVGFDKDKLDNFANSLLFIKDNIIFHYIIPPFKLWGPLLSLQSLYQATLYT